MIKKWNQFIKENIDEFTQEVKPYLQVFEDEFNLETIHKVNTKGEIYIIGKNSKFDKNITENLQNVLNLIMQYYNHFQISFMKDDKRCIGKGVSNKKGNIQWQWNFRIDKTTGHERYNQYKYFKSIEQLTTKELDSGWFDYISIYYGNF